MSFLISRLELVGYQLAGSESYAVVTLLAFIDGTVAFGPIRAVPTRAEVRSLGSVQVGSSEIALIEHWNRRVMVQKSSLPDRQTLTEIVAETVPFGFLVSDELDQIVFVNRHAERLLGYSERELLQQSLGDLIPGARENAQPCDPSQRPETGRAPERRRCSPLTSVRKTLTLRAKDGSEFFADVNFAAVRRNGQQWSVVSIDCLAEQNPPPHVTRIQAISEMVQGLAHECRNALQRARGCLDLLELDLGTEPQLLGLTARIRQSLEDLQRNYTEVQEYSAPIILEKQHCGLKDLIREAFSELQEQYDAYCGPIELLGSDHEFQNRVDESRLQWVFRNLLENAIHASQPNAPIQIRASLEESDGCVWQVLEVRDQGSGIDPNIRGRIFEPFFTTKQKGNGLGLAICKRIVEAHEGQVTLLESEQRCGTCIRLALPWGRPDTSEYCASESQAAREWRMR